MLFAPYRTETGTQLVSRAAGVFPRSAGRPIRTLRRPPCDRGSAVPPVRFRGLPCRARPGGTGRRPSRSGGPKLPGPVAGPPPATRDGGPGRRPSRPGRIAIVGRSRHEQRGPRPMRRPDPAARSDPDPGDVGRWTGPGGSAVTPAGRGPTENKKTKFAPIWPSSRKHESTKTRKKHDQTTANHPRDGPVRRLSSFCRIH